MFTRCVRSSALKKTVTLILALVLAPSCSLSGPPAGKPAVSGKRPRIVFVSVLLGHPVWLEAKRGAEDAGKELGFDLEWVGPSTIDLEAMARLLENAVDSRPDGILYVPPPVEGIEQVYEKAKKAGIPMVSVQADSPPETRLSHIGTEPVAYGQRAAELLGQKMNGKAKIAVIADNLANPFQGAKIESLKKTLAEKYPGMELVVTETDESDIAIAVDKIDQILKTYPQVNAFVMLVAEGAPAAAQVLKKNNRQDVVVLGIDDMAETLQAIREGWVWATLVQDFYKMGYEGAKLIMDAHAGKPVPSSVDSGTIFVTSENITSYKK